jgi:hypothetical protein
VRTLLHLHPGTPRFRHELLARQRAWLQERELELVLGDDRIVDADRDHYAACVALPPEEQVAASLARLTSFARSRRIDGVLAQSEAGLAVGALLARELSLPGPSPEAALRTIDKHRTRETLSAARVDQPPFVVAAGAADVRAFAAAHGYPIVLKAFASCMARLVTEVDAPEQVEAAVARMRDGLPRSQDVARMIGLARAARLELGPDPRAAFLCESFAGGVPLECDGFVHGGRARSFGVVEQVLTPPPRFYFEGYLLPADRPDEERAAIAATAERVAAALGLDAAGYAIELRADGGAGPKPTVRVIEANGRLGEDDGLHRLYELAVGADPFRLAVAVALGERPAFSPRASPRHAVAYQCAFVEGEVAALPGEAELAALAADARVVDAGLCVRVGDALHAPPHPETFPHLAWALARDARSSRDAFARASELVRGLRFGLVQAARS